NAGDETIELSAVARLGAREDGDLAHGQPRRTLEEMRLRHAINSWIDDSSLNGGQEARPAPRSVHSGAVRTVRSPATPASPSRRTAGSTASGGLRAGQRN